MRTLQSILGRLEPALARFRDATGQTLAEYSIVVTVVAVGVTVLSVVAFRGALVGAFNAVTNCLDGSC